MEGSALKKCVKAKWVIEDFKFHAGDSLLMLTVEVPSTVLIFKARMYIIHVLTCLHVYHVHEMIDCPDLELQAVVTCLMCVLGTQPRSSIRAASIVCE